MQLVTYTGLRYYLILLVGESSTVSFLGAFAKFRKATVGFIMSIFLSTWYVQLSLQWMDFCEILDFCIFWTSVKKIQVSLKSDKNIGTLHEGLYTFMIISCSFILKMRNVSDKCCRENQNIHFMFNYVFLRIVIFMR